MLELCFYIGTICYLIFWRTMVVYIWKLLVINFLHDNHSTLVQTLNLERKGQKKTTIVIWHTHNWGTQKGMSHYKSFHLIKFNYGIFFHFYYIINLINFKSCNENKDNSIFKFDAQFNILMNLWNINFSHGHTIIKVRFINPIQYRA